MYVYGLNLSALIIFFIFWEMSSCLIVFDPRIWSSLDSGWDADCARPSKIFCSLKLIKASLRRKLLDLIDQLVVGKSDNIVAISRFDAAGSGIGIGRCGGVGGVELSSTAVIGCWECTTPSALRRITDFFQDWLSFLGWWGCGWWTKSAAIFYNAMVGRQIKRSIFWQALLTF